MCAIRSYSEVSRAPHWLFFLVVLNPRFKPCLGSWSSLLFWQHILFSRMCSVQRCRVCHGPEQDWFSQVSAGTSPSKCYSRFLCCNRRSGLRTSKKTKRRRCCSSRRNPGWETIDGSRRRAGMEPWDGESKHGNFPEEEEEENELLPSGAKATRHLGKRRAEFAGGNF